MSLVKSAFFVKNVPNGERAVRVAASSLGIILAFATLHSPWSWLAAFGSGSFALTGLVGFCPACALAGRRLVEKD